MRNDRQRLGHEALVRVLVERLKRRGYDEIHASLLDEYEGKRPPIVFWENTDEGFRPDVTARKEGAEYMFAVETAASLLTPATARKIALFGAYAGLYRRHFCLIVPESSLGQGRTALRECAVDERFMHIVGA